MLEAIAAADVVSLGPGSWYTSVLPHLLVPALRAALVATQARVVVVLNLEPQPGETDGFSPEEHLSVLQAHLGGVALHTVIADADSVVDRRGLLSAVRECGAELVLAPVAALDGAPRHDPVRLSRRWPPWSACDEGVRVSDRVSELTAAVVGPDRSVRGGRGRRTWR